ncbi:MAG: tetratricopeptide repeat protein [Pseudomonadota bacterium]
MHSFRLAAALALFAPAALACPALPDRSAEFAALFDEARAAPNEMLGRAASDKMWAIWTTAPDAAAQELLAQGMTARRYGDFLAAIRAFDALTTYCPDYAEGYNQRAFIYFLSGDPAKALPDLERTIAITPDHVGALSGLALTLIQLGREDEAQAYLRDALALNPWIPERGLLKEPPGKEL